MNDERREEPKGSRNLEFGCRAITLQQLKEIAIVNLKSEIAQEPILEGVSYLKGLSNENKRTYHAYRLGMITWFSHMLNDDNFVFLTAVATNLMDRYVSCICVEDTSVDLLSRMRAIGTVCYMLTLKMHSANMLVYATDIVKNTRTPETPYSKGEDMIAMQLSWGLPPTKGELDLIELDIVTRLKGNVFTSDLNNLTKALCCYLVRATLSETTLPEDDRKGLESRAQRLARSYAIKTLLEPSFLEYARWKCIAASCLYATAQECELDKSDSVEECTKELLCYFREESDVRDIVTISQELTRDCIACTLNYPTKDMLTSLYHLSASYCEHCRCKNK